jgi:hypothetical protein
MKSNVSHVGHTGPDVSHVYTTRGYLSPAEASRIGNQRLSHHAHFAECLHSEHPNANELCLRLMARYRLGVANAADVRAACSTIIGPEAFAQVRLTAHQLLAIGREILDYLWFEPEHPHTWIDMVRVRLGLRSIYNEWPPDWCHRTIPDMVRSYGGLPTRGDMILAIAKFVDLAHLLEALSDWQLMDVYPSALNRASTKWNPTHAISLDEFGLMIGSYLGLEGYPRGLRHTLANGKIVPYCGCFADWLNLRLGIGIDRRRRRLAPKAQ